MASSIMSSATVATLNRSTPTQASMVAPFTGLKSSSAFPVTKKANNDITTHANNGGRVQCMQVWPTTGKKKFETLSYLPPLSREQLGKEVDYLLRSGWVPCLEFELQHGFVYRENHRSPGYYDGRYWTMWKLPMFGCNDSAQNVIVSCFRTDEEVAHLFAKIASNMVPDPHMYAEAKRGIQKYCNSKFQQWMAECYNTHFTSPWTLLALCGAISVILLTVAQTFLAAWQRKN